ncbi:MAG: glycosyltransferase [Lachnospiraceae bacterium]|nr:glycosyltransferase [Lachnospiraceae bacterium]
MDMAKSYGIAPEKLGCIYNFLDPEKIEVQSREALPADAAAFYAKHPRMLISMGRLTAMKGQDRMIRLLRELRKEDDGVGLTILGEGEERASLTALAGELELTEHVYLPGELPNPFPWLKAASVFLLFSDYEGLPMVLIEAASVKLPVAACDVASGPREILAPDTDIQNFTDKAEYARYGVLLPSLAGEERRGELGEKECMTEQAVKRLLYDEKLRGRYIERSAECAERFSTAQQIGKWRKRIDG